MPRIVRRKAAHAYRFDPRVFHEFPSSFRTDFPFEGARIPVFVARPAAAPKVTGSCSAMERHRHIEDLCLKLAKQGIGAIAPCLFRGENIPARDAPPDVLRRRSWTSNDRRACAIRVPSSCRP